MFLNQLEIDKKKLKEYYEKQGKSSNYDVYYSSWSLKNALFKRRREVILKMLPKNRNGIALDLGCGVGVYSADMANIGFEVCSVDISKSYLEKAKELAKIKGIYSRQSFIVADAESFLLEVDALT
jgi:ubiquinone/menaquinone biosynthesis C-methylase UbiE